MQDVPELKQTLWDHVLVNIKAELDQFSEGLNTLGVLKKIPLTNGMAPLFIDTGKKELDKREFDNLGQN